LSWSAYQCPDINECKIPELNKCGPNSTCINNVNADVRFTIGYECACDEGYEPKNATHCVPVCEVKCVFGTCAAPNECECDLGWTGAICDIDCGCNGHSTCVTAIGVCDECQDNTTGTFCTDCVTGAYGNGTWKGEPFNGTCKDCGYVCNGHSTDCKTGPSEPGPTCVGCGDNSKGDRCDECSDGFFIDPTLQAVTVSSNGTVNGLETTNQRVARIKAYVKLDAVMSACVPCRCNGHGSTVCDPYSGEGCECRNYTYETCVTAQKTNGSCYSRQCDTCSLKGEDEEGIETTIEGTPADGHLCYGILSEYDLFKGTLEPGQVMGFKITKKYSNVPIRVYVRVDIPGTVGIHAIIDSSAARPNPMISSELEFNETALVSNYTPSFNVQELVLWDSERPDFIADNDLHIILSRMDDGITKPKFHIFFTQAQSSTLHLFVFFTGFFAAFFLALFIIGMVFATKAYQVQRQMLALEAVELENMATRPMAGVRMLVSKHTAHLEQAAHIAQLQSGHQMYSTPLAMQPHKSGKACVSTFLIEFPSELSTGHRNFSLGYALTNGGALRPPPPIVNESEAESSNNNSTSNIRPNIPTQETISL